MQAQTLSIPIQWAQRLQKGPNIAVHARFRRGYQVSTWEVLLGLCAHSARPAAAELLSCLDSSNPWLPSPELHRMTFDPRVPWLVSRDVCCAQWSKDLFAYRDLRDRREKKKEKRGR